MLLQMLAGHYEAMTVCDHCGNIVSYLLKGHDGGCCKEQCEAEADEEEEVLEVGLLRTLAHGC